ncbi:MAG TPA: hypothetical protein PLM76_09055 [Tenuifilaceae bacterium]|nr:hypothetical protein [Tenuifilaceae bacterium]
MMKVIEREKIDVQKYTEKLEQFECTETAMQPWILDAVSPGWGMLADSKGDYLMPLPIRYKFLIPYVTMPVFGQRFEILVNNPVEIFPKVIRNLKGEFLRGDINFNIEGLKRRKVKLMQTYQLPLEKSYADIFAAMDEGHRKNITKAKKMVDVQVSPQSWGLLCDMKRDLLDDKNVRFTEFNQVSYVRFVEIAVKEHGAKLYVANFEDDVVAAALFVQVGNRFVIDSATSPQGRKSSAMYAIVNQFIEDYSGSGSILDFAGSSIPSIAAFRKGFGATRSEYINVQWRWI